MAYNKNNILLRPWKELKALQNRKLRYFINRQIYPFSLYYRQLFDKHKINPASILTVSDLKQIPFTSKDDFIALLKQDAMKANLAFILRPDAGLIRQYLPKSEVAGRFFTAILSGHDSLKSFFEYEYQPIFLTATAGTTYQPISFLYTSYDLNNLRIYGKRIVEVINIEKDQRAVNIFPYAPHLAFWQTVFAGFGGNVLIISTGGGKTMGTEGNIRSLLNAKPQFLIGVPSYTYHLLKTAQEQNLKLNFLNRIVLGAGAVPLGFKLKLANILTAMGATDIRVMGTYGFTESRCAWAECPTEIGVSSGYHTYPDKEVFEIINPETGEVQPEGRDGEIVYSNIDSRGSCVLRYRTGDLVRGGIVYSPCPYCGRTMPRISSEIYRASNIKDMQLSKIKGSLVNLNNLMAFLDDHKEIHEWQIELRKKDNDPYEVDELVLYVSVWPQVNKEQFAATLNQEVLATTDISFNKINFVSGEEIKQRIEIETAVKAKKIIDNRPK